MTTCVNYYIHWKPELKKTNRWITMAIPSTDTFTYIVTRYLRAYADGERLCILSQGYQDLKFKRFYGDTMILSIISNVLPQTSHEQTSKIPDIFFPTSYACYLTKLCLLSMDTYAKVLTCIKSIRIAAYQKQKWHTEKHTVWTHKWAANDMVSSLLLKAKWI